MKAALVVGAVFLGVACQHQVSPRVEGFGAGSKDLLARARELQQAITLRDSAKAESMLAPEYTLHFIDRYMQGSLQKSPGAPRGKWLADAFKHVSNGPLEWAINDVRVYEDIGVVTSHYRWIGTYYNQGFQSEGFITDVWLYRDGRWQLLSSTADFLD